LDQQIKKTEVALRKLPHLEDSQGEFCLLRSCLSLPKLSYSLRTFDPILHAPSYARFDGLLREIAGIILGGRELGELQWKQATLAVSIGGMGLRSATAHAAASFVVSAIHSAPLVTSIVGQRSRLLNCPNFAVALDSLNSAVATPFSIEDIWDSTPKCVSHAVNLYQQDELHAASGDTRTTARLNSVSLKHAGDWLNAQPSYHLGLHMRPQEFRVAAQYRLGITVFASEGVHLESTS
jgi:hypothetical protein